MLRVAHADLVSLKAPVEPLKPILANRLQHEEASLVSTTEEAFVDKRLEHFQVGLGDDFGTVEVETASEDG